MLKYHRYVTFLLDFNRLFVAVVILAEFILSHRNVLRLMIMQLRDKYSSAFRWTSHSSIV